MTKEEFHSRLSQGPLIVDGATGTNLMTAGMPHGVSTEAWVLDHPEVLIQLQRDYVSAGSHAVYAPTFRANRIALDAMGLHTPVGPLVEQLVALSHQAVQGTDALVAGDLGTSGVLPAPYGPLTYEAMLEAYTEQISALARAGVDFLAAETLMTADEALALLDGAASCCDLPVLCTMTVEADGSLLFGGNVFDAAADLEAMGADAVGVNCSVGPDQLEAIVAGIRQRVSIPVVAKPNAGLPEITEEGEAVYPMGPREFARYMAVLHRAGANVLGGCCGTTPDYIRAMCAALAHA